MDEEGCYSPWQATLTAPRRSCTYSVKGRAPTASTNMVSCVLLPRVIFESIFYLFIFISWRLITSQHLSGFCHTLTWISHGVESIISNIIVDNISSVCWSFHLVYVWEFTNVLIYPIIFPQSFPVYESGVNPRGHLCTLCWPIVN